MPNAQTEEEDDVDAGYYKDWQCVHEGWVMKRTSTLKNWESTYMVLYSEKILMYNDFVDSKAAKEVTLTETMESQTNSTLLRSQVSVESSHPFCFSITPTKGGKCYYFAVDTKKTLSQWHSALRRCIAGPGASPPEVSTASVAGTWVQDDAASWDDALKELESSTGSLLSDDDHSMVLRLNDSDDELPPLMDIAEFGLYDIQLEENETDASGRRLDSPRKASLLPAPSMLDDDTSSTSVLTAPRNQKHSRRIAQIDWTNLLPSETLSTPPRSPKKQQQPVPTTNLGSPSMIFDPSKPQVAIPDEDGFAPQLQLHHGHVTPRRERQSSRSGADSPSKASASRRRRMSSTASRKTPTPRAKSKTALDLNDPQVRLRQLCVQTFVLVIYHNILTLKKRSSKESSVSDIVLNMVQVIGDAISWEESAIRLIREILAKTLNQIDSSKIFHTDYKHVGWRNFFELMSCFRKLMCMEVTGGVLRSTNVARLESLEPSVAVAALASPSTSASPSSPLDPQPLNQDSTEKPAARQSGVRLFTPKLLARTILCLQGLRLQTVGEGMESSYETEEWKLLMKHKKTHNSTLKYFSKLLRQKKI